MTDQASQLRHTEDKIDSTHTAHHIVPPSVYFTVLIILLCLTILTAAVSFHDFGGLWNLVLALGIATVKATLVALWFMHVRYSGKLIQITILTALMFLMLMMFGTLMDVWTRHNVTNSDEVPTYEYDRMAKRNNLHGDNSLLH